MTALPLPLYFRLLRRWEVSRVEVASKLLPNGGALLDLGCGDGDLIGQVGERYEQIVGTDVSPAVIEQAKERHGQKGGAGRIDWRVLDGNVAFPFEDQRFDVVVSLSTLQYIFDPEVFLAECFRVLRPVGRIRRKAQFDARTRASEDCRPAPRTHRTRPA